MGRHSLIVAGRFSQRVSSRQRIRVRVRRPAPLRKACCFLGLALLTGDFGLLQFDDFPAQGTAESIGRVSLKGLLARAASTSLTLARGQHLYGKPITELPRLAPCSTLWFR